jgi:hypothetical protein
MNKKIVYLSALIACATTLTVKPFIFLMPELAVINGLAIVAGSTLLTPVSATLYAVGKYCYIKSGAPAYKVNYNPWNLVT